MGTKLRKQQLKKEWTESGTLFSPDYLEKVFVNLTFDAKSTSICHP